MSTDNIERREYFRVSDNAIVSLEKITSDKSLTDLKTKNSTFILGSEISALDFENQTLFNNIKRKHSDIAHYLEVINKKIDLISNHLLESSINDQEQEEIEIDLSASGIAVTTTDSYSEQDKVMIKLLLLPEKKGIICIGEIIRIKTTNQSTTLCIDFTEIAELDKELIIKHTINKQLEQARSKKDQQDLL